MEVAIFYFLWFLSLSLFYFRLFDRAFYRTEDRRADVLGGVRASLEKNADEDRGARETVETEHSESSRTWRKLLPRLPRDCVRFSEQTVYAKPSLLLKDMMANLPANRQLNEDQELFMLRFADVLDTVYDEAAWPFVSFS